MTCSTSGSSTSRSADSPAAQVVAALARRGETLATCESLTAGMLAAEIATVPGASRVLRGGLIVYATDLKARLAGVDQDILDRVGPVAAEIAAAMARGAQHTCQADWALALTGVAGPDSQDGHPVGTVFLGVAGPHGTDVEEWGLVGGRAEIREAACQAALTALIRKL